MVQTPLLEYSNNVLKPTFNFPEARMQCSKSMLNVLNWMLVKSVSDPRYKEKISEWSAFIGNVVQLFSQMFPEVNLKLLQQYVERSLYIRTQA